MSLMFGRKTDDTRWCGRCHAALTENAKYCSYCGTKRGKGGFWPEFNDVEDIYGPPIKTKYHCKHCGYDWVIHNLGPDTSKYCPQCGHKKLEMSYEDDYEPDDDDDVYILTEEALKTMLIDQEGNGSEAF